MKRTKPEVVHKLKIGYFLSLMGDKRIIKYIICKKIPNRYNVSRYYAYHWKNVTCKSCKKIGGKL